MRYSSSQPPSMDVWPATAQFIQDLIVNNSSMVNDGSAEVLSNLFKAISMDGSTRSMLEFDELPSFPPVRSTFSTWSSFDYTTERNTNYLRRLSTITGDGSTNSFIVNIVLVFVCIICAGFASGLTQGLLSLDLTEMTIKSRSGTPKEKIYADRLIPIISRHHLLIVTLMLWNVTATEALPIFLSGLVPEYLALIISVILVLFFGEIIPAAILTGPNQLMIAANLIPLVYIVHVIFFVIAYPISLVLDYFLGHDGRITLYNRKEIATMIDIQHEEGKGKGAPGDSLHLEEMNIIGGALKFRDMLVKEVMTSKENVFMLPVSEKLNYKIISDIYKSGFSRIPVYGIDRNDIIGLILTKDLIFIDPDDETSISHFLSLFGRQPVVIWHDQKLGETLSVFRKGRSHMAIVRNVCNKGPGDPFYEVVGIITLEDIIEEILGGEIEDETDYNSLAVDRDRMVKRDNDFSRLQILNAKSEKDALKKKQNKESLTFSEVKVIAAHLMANSPQMAELLGDTGDFDTMSTLVEVSPVVELQRASRDPLKPQPEDMLYKSGKATNSCTLVLNGTVAVLAGKESTKTELGPWTLIAGDALLQSDGRYTPNYSVYIVSDVVRVLRINIHSPEAQQIKVLQKMKDVRGINTTSSENRLSFVGKKKLPSDRLEKFPSGDYVPPESLGCGEVLGFQDKSKIKNGDSDRSGKGKEDEKTKRRKSIKVERGEVEVTEEDERKFERKLRRRSSTRFHPDFSLESALLDNDRDEEDKRLSRKGRRASGRYETDVLQILQENEEDDERRKLERKERRVSARFNPDTINEKLLHENEKDDEERKLERKERRVSARFNPDTINEKLLHENEKDDEERKFERKIRRRSSTRFHPDVIKLSSENDKKNEVDSDLKKKWKNNREQVMKNLQIFMQGMDDTENEYQEDVRDDMSQSEADSIPPARVLMNKKVPVPVPVRVQGDRCTDKVQVPLSKIKKELEGTGTGSDATGGKETDNSREKMMLEKEREKERLAAEKERQKIMHERERERVMIQERERQRIMSEKEKERIRIGQDRERERALIERERIMQEKEKAFQQKEKNFNSPKEEDSMLRVPRNLKIDTGYSSMTSGSDRDIGGSKGKGIGGGGGVGNQNDMYGRARPAVVPSANASPSANQNRPRPKGSFSENVSKNHSRHGSFMEGAGGGSAGGFYAGLPVTSPIVMVDGPFFLSADPPTTSYATHRPLGGSFMSNSLRSTPTSKGNRCTQSFVSTGSRNQSHNNSLGNIIEREAARRQSSHKLDDDKGVDLNLSYDNIYSKDQDDDSSDSDVVSGTNFNSPKNRPDSAKNNSSKLNINNSNNIKNNQKETRVGNRSVEKKKENFRHVDEFYTEGEVPTKSRDEINNNNNDDNSVSTVSHSKYGDNENASMSESDVTTFSAPNYKFPPKKYNFKKK